MQHRPGQITPETFGETVVTYHDVDAIPALPASLVSDALTAITRLAQAFQPGVADALAERLLVRPNNSGVLRWRASDCLSAQPRRSRLRSTSWRAAGSGTNGL